MTLVSDSHIGVWVVVAAYNEGRVVADVVRPLVEGGYRVVLVDDGYVDGQLPSHNEDGRGRKVRTIWIVDRGSDVPRLVTAYPTRNENSP